MASRRETRLAGGANQLADAEIQLNDPLIGNVDENVLTEILTAQHGAGAQAPPPPARTLIETDYALESFQRSYETQIEVARVAGTLTYSTPTPTKKSKGPKKASKTTTLAVDQGLTVPGFGLAPAHPVSVSDVELSPLRRSARLQTEETTPTPRPVAGSGSDFPNSKCFSDIPFLSTVLTLWHRFSFAP
jgi:hypothetical protein